MRLRVYVLVLEAGELPAQTGLGEPSMPARLSKSLRQTRPLVRKSLMASMHFDAFSVVGRTEIFSYSPARGHKSKPKKVTLGPSWDIADLRRVPKQGPKRVEVRKDLLTREAGISAPTSSK